VTASGGEPGVQAGFVEAFLGRCRDLGLHTAVDTCALVGTPALLRMVSRADLVMLDLKVIDTDLHRQLTGHPNERILDNARAVRDRLRETGGELWVRTPLIPGATATEDNLRGIGAFIAAELAPVVTRWELCSFNNLCIDKYRRLGLTWRFADAELLTRAEQLQYQAIAASSGVAPDLVVATGPTRVHRGADS
jgi:pyruvate formate lyase activating enzyme